MEEELNVCQTVPSAIRQSIRQMGYARLRLEGTSMLPSIVPETLLTIEPVKSIRPGMVLAFESDDQITIHRAIKEKDGLWWCKGDAAVNFDLPVQFQQVIGKVSKYRTFWDDYDQAIEEKIPFTARKNTRIERAKQALYRKGAKVLFNLDRVPLLRNIGAFYYKSGAFFLRRLVRKQQDMKLFIRGSYVKKTWKPGISDIDPYFIVPDEWLSRAPTGSVFQKKLVNIGKFFPIVQHYLFLEQTCFNAAIKCGYVSDSHLLAWDLPESSRTQQSPYRAIGEKLKAAQRFYNKCKSFVNALNEYFSTRDAATHTMRKLKLERVTVKVFKILTEISSVPLPTEKIETIFKDISPHEEIGRISLLALLGEVSEQALKSSQELLGAYIPPIDETIFYNNLHILPDSTKVLVQKTLVDFQLQHGIHDPKLHATFSLLQIAEKISEYVLYGMPLHADNCPFTEHKYDLICQKLGMKRIIPYRRRIPSQLQGYHLARACLDTIRQLLK